MSLLKICLQSAPVVLGAAMLTSCISPVASTFSDVVSSTKQTSAQLGATASGTAEGELEIADSSGTVSGESSIKPEPAKTQSATASVGSQSSSGAQLLSTSSGPVDTSFNFPNIANSNLLVRTTAYSHQEADSLPYGKKNAFGGYLQYTNTIRSAASDWSRFPVGTRFKIKGQPYEYVIDDYGSALLGTNTIDLYKPTISKMNEWGARNVPIEILQWGCFHKSREILQGRTHVKHADHVRKMLSDIEARYM